MQFMKEDRNAIHIQNRGTTAHSGERNSAQGCLWTLKSETKPKLRDSNDPDSNVEYGSVLFSPPNVVASTGVAVTKQRRRLNQL